MFVKLTETLETNASYLKQEPSTLYSVSLLKARRPDGELLDPSQT